MSYKVKLQSFEGPFDLLVYLIENAQMSIYDIKISQITSQYLSYMKALETADVVVSTEFMVLAATLIEIKSKMILPKQNVDGETIIEEDPRTELVERLLEYKKFKKISQMLEHQEERDQHIFEKPQEDLSEFLDHPEEYLHLDINQFVSGFYLFIEKKQKVDAVRKHYAKVERERESMESRMSSIIFKLRKRIGQVFNFKELIHNKKERYDIVVTFLSLLEMAKERVISIEQKTTYGDIEVSAGERINEDLILNKYRRDPREEEEDTYVEQKNNKICI